MDDNNQVPDKIDKNFEENRQQLAEDSCKNEGRIKMK